MHYNHLAHLQGYIPVKESLVSEENLWTKHKNILRVLWRDEFKFKSIGCDRKQYVLQIKV